MTWASACFSLALSTWIWALRAVALVESGEVVLVGVVERLLADDAFLWPSACCGRGSACTWAGRARRRSLCPARCWLRRCRHWLPRRRVRPSGLQPGRGSPPGRAGRGAGLCGRVIDVDVELFDDAGGFGFDFDFGDGLDFAGGNDGASNVSASDLGDLVGIDGSARDHARDRYSGGADDDYNYDDDPDPDLPAFSRSHWIPPGGARPHF